jgi:hypothetical protein
MITDHQPTVSHMRPPLNISIRPPHIRALNLQPTIQSDLPPCQRSILPLPRNRLFNRQRRWRQTLRPRSEEMDHKTQRSASAPRPTEQRSCHTTRSAPRCNAHLLLDTGGGSGWHGRTDNRRFFCWRGPFGCF